MNAPGYSTAETVSFGTPSSGSWQWTQAGNASNLASDDSLDDYAQQLFSLLGQNVDAQQAFLGKFELASAATVVGAN